ncbi:MAG: NAD-dependent protein deacylase [Propionibacteriales bacterium]|nr:NAD-dependent protein deacylase [Propionibacteriales bacterium]
MNELARVLTDADRIVFFGGAGVSTESGIPDFRSSGGLYHQQTGTSYPPEAVLSRSFFDRYPDDFYDFYRRYLLHPDAQPNPAHRALARLEAAGKLTAVITQNIDGLHQAAGSTNVLELHGSVHRNLCLACGRSYPLQTVLAADGVPRCSCGGVIKPDVVLYEEALDPAVIEASIRHLEAADTLIVGGTSLVVYPAAGLVQAFGGRNLILINTQATAMDAAATLVVREPIGAALGAAVP